MCVRARFCAILRGLPFPPPLISWKKATAKIWRENFPTRMIYIYASVEKFLFPGQSPQLQSIQQFPPNSCLNLNALVKVRQNGPDRNFPCWLDPVIRVGAPWLAARRSGGSFNYYLPPPPTLNIDIVATQHWTISSTRCSFPMAPVKYFNDLTAVMFGLGEIWVFKSPAKCAGCQFCFKPREKRIFKTYFQPYANQQTEWDIFSLLFLQSL